MAARQNNSTAPAASAILNENTVPSREQFVREYMAQLSQNRPPKVSLVSKLAGWVEDRGVDAVKNSRRTFGRVQAAWEISDAIREEAYATEHARHAEAMALRLGLK